IRQTLRRGLASRPTFGDLGCSLKLWWLQPCHEQYCGSKPACASIIVFSSAQAGVIRCADAMSALGQKQTSEHGWIMSALTPKADMDQHGRDVRFVPKGDFRNDNATVKSLSSPRSKTRNLRNGKCQ